MELPDIQFGDWSNAQVWTAIGALLAGFVVREAFRILTGISELLAAGLGKLKDKALKAIERW